MHSKHNGKNLILLKLIVSFCSLLFHLDTKFKPHLQRTFATVVAKSGTTEPYYDVHPLLDQLVQTKKLILFGSSGHENTRVGQVTIDFLNKYGKSESLKKIFIEAPYDQKDLFAKLSIYDISEAELLPKLSSLDGKLFCAPFYAYLFKTFFPIVRSINKLRKDKLIIIPIDSMSSSRESDWPFLDREKGTEKDCRYSGSKITFIDSHTREQITAKNFISEFQSLKENQKGLVIYHSGHLIRNSTSCRFSQDVSGNWFSSWGTTSWFEIAYNQSSKVRQASATILLDEIDLYHSPNGIFEYNEKTNKEKEFILEFNSDSYYPRLNKSVLTDLFEYPTNQIARKAKLFDYSWWSPGAEKNIFRSEKDTLPLICGDR